MNFFDKCDFQQGVCFVFIFGKMFRPRGTQRRGRLFQGLYTIDLVIQLLEALAYQPIVQIKDKAFNEIIVFLVLTVSQFHSAINQDFCAKKLCDFCFE